MMKIMKFQFNNKTQGYRTPSKLRYRIERIWLRAWLRKLILRTTLFVFFSITLLICLISFRDEFKLRDLKHAIELFFYERPELLIHSLSIKNADSDLVNQIKAILQLSFPINPLKIDINYLQELINNIESVDFSKIRVTESGVLEVIINERVPVVVHRDDTNLMLLDISGRRIGEVFSRLDKLDLPLIVGSGASTRVPEALEIYKVSNPILHRIRGIILVGGRRWDIVLDLNQRIKLPEKKPGMVLGSFLASGNAMKILRHDFSVIDLRFWDRIIVRKKTLVPIEESI